LVLLLAGFAACATAAVPSASAPVAAGAPDRADKAPAEPVEIPVEYLGARRVRHRAATVASSAPAAPGEPTRRLSARFFCRAHSLFGQLELGAELSATTEGRDERLADDPNGDFSAQIHRLKQRHRGNARLSLAALAPDGTRLPLPVAHIDADLTASSEWRWPDFRKGSEVVYREQSLVLSPVHDRALRGAMERVHEGKEALWSVSQLMRRTLPALNRATRLGPRLALARVEMMRRYQYDSRLDFLFRTQASAAYELVLRPVEVYGVRELRLPLSCDFRGWPLPVPPTIAALPERPVEAFWEGVYQRLFKGEIAPPAFQAPEER
jgi:hypothetical protein